MTVDIINESITLISRATISTSRQGSRILENRTQSNPAARWKTL